MLCYRERRHPSDHVRRNRRFGFLSASLAESSDDTYFTIEEMRMREPALFHNMVGKFLSAEERSRPFDSGMLVYQKLLENYDMSVAQGRIQEVEEEEEEDSEEDSEEEAEEEEEDNEEEEDEDRMTDTDPLSADRGLFGLDGPRRRKKALTDDEKDALYQEFAELMHARFLGGLDALFEYAKVDFCEDYDDVQMTNRDMEERYFDDEEPTAASNHDTGEQDF